MKISFVSAQSVLVFSVASLGLNAHASTDGVGGSEAYKNFESTKSVCGANPVFPQIDSTLSQIKCAALTQYANAYVTASGDNLSQVQSSAVGADKGFRLSFENLKYLQTKTGSKLSQVNDYGNAASTGADQAKTFATTTVGATEAFKNALNNLGAGDYQSSEKDYAFEKDMNTCKSSMKKTKYFDNETVQANCVKTCTDYASAIKKSIDDCSAKVTDLHAYASQDVASATTLKSSVASAYQYAKNNVSTPAATVKTPSITVKPSSDTYVSSSDDVTGYSNRLPASQGVQTKVISPKGQGGVTPSSTTVTTPTTTTTSDVVTTPGTTTTSSNDKTANHGAAASLVQSMMYVPVNGGSSGGGTSAQPVNYAPATARAQSIQDSRSKYD